MESLNHNLILNVNWFNYKVSSCITLLLATQLKSAAAAPKEREIVSLVLQRDCYKKQRVLDIYHLDKI